MSVHTKISSLHEKSMSTTTMESFSYSLIVTLLCSSILATTHASQGGTPLPFHFLREKTGISGHHVDGVSCLSWRLGVETNNVRNWRTVPAECENYVGHYMLGHLYRKDSKVVIDEAILYAQSFNLSGDGKEAWVFDIDETTLSNLPYYAKHGFGAQPFNGTIFDAWVDTGMALALPESLKLYKVLLKLGFKTVFLTGRVEKRRDITLSNLKRAGYRNWTKLLLRGPSDVGKMAVAFKSEQRKKLEDGGFRIVGNVGDQWSDLLGTNTGSRTFKLPDPMYYIS